MKICQMCIFIILGFANFLICISLPFANFCANEWSREIKIETIVERERIGLSCRNVISDFTLHHPALYSKRLSFILISEKCKGFTVLLT